MSEIQKRTPEQVLSSGLRSINSMVATATSTPQLLNSKSRVLESLATCTAKVDQFLTLSKGKEQLALRKQCKYLKNLLVSLSEGVENEETDVDDFIESVSGELAERAEAVDILLSSLCNSDDEDLTSGDLELSDIDGLTKKDYDELDLASMPKEKIDQKIKTFREAATKLNRYDRFKRILAKRLPDTTSFVPVELPVLVRFGGMRLNNQAVLEQVFPGRIDPIGTASKKSSDVGLVLTKQIVMQFSKSYALQWAKEIAEASPIAERAANSQAIVRNLRKNIASNKTRLDYVQQQLGSKKITVYERKRLQKEIDEINSTIERLESSLERNVERAKEDGSVKRAKVKSSIKANEAYVAYMKHMLELMSERGRDYTILSNSIVVSPHNSDIALVWIVSSQQYRKLAGFNGGEVSVTSWGFPWTKEGTKRETSAVPKSIFLSTKVSR